ncbi:MAG: hypothetical protein WAW36_03520 [Methylovulum miyakonense]|uniref:hypothetical protein n=1 Tax=Methylovulum miyakonense TaxID=645578 RepID=UPI003BB492B1
MNRVIPIAFLALFSFTASHAAEHHSGHGGGVMGGGGGGGGCMKPKLAKFTPEHLATAAPESEISFVVLNIEHPSQISVRIKDIPVEILTEYKEPFYLVKTKLPASLRNTAARVNIKISAKSAHCEGEGGWLLKISG